MDPQALADAIRRKALSLDFARVGICEAVVPEEAAYFVRWLEDGHHGRMEWMARGRDRRLDPGKVLPGARSFVMVAHPHASDGPSAAAPGSNPDGTPGFVARYARGSDYHDVMGRRLALLAGYIEELAPGHRALSYVDTGPLLERMWAARAGIGWVGKNAMVLNEEMGSYFLLGAVITTLGLPPDEPATDRCGRCALCIDACPTGAIVAPRVVDSRRCISYQTIELRGPIPEPDRVGVGTRLFGCDDCQDACPYNRPEQPASAAIPGERPGTARAPLISLIAMTRHEYQTRFKGSAMKRATFDGLKRNAALALGNAAASATGPQKDAARRALRRAAEDEREAPAVREQAAWSLRRLDSGSGSTGR